MKKIIISLLFVVLFSSKGWAVDVGVITAINQQTAVQTAEHVKRFTEVLNTVQLLKSQVADTQNLLKLAKKASEGIEGVEFVSDFRNIVMETNEVLDTVKDYIDTAENLSC